VGAGEWCRRRREAAPLVDGVLREAGKPTGGASTGWRGKMLVERVEVLGWGWLACRLGGGWRLGVLAGGLGIRLGQHDESGDI